MKFTWQANACAATLVLVLGAAGAQAQTIDLSKLKPFCDSPFKLSAAGDSCEPVTAEIEKIKTAPKCAGPSLKWDADKCTSVAGKEPEPTCGNDLPDLVVKDKKCVVQRTTPRSSLGDFVGDCLHLIALPPEGGEGLSANSYWNVESQTVMPNEDKRLVVAPATPFPGQDFVLFCKTTGEQQRYVPASAFIRAGAHRYGWAYGVLVLPFKAYPHDKSFTPGTLSVGPYLGRRWGSSGSAITAAVAAAVGSVRGEVRDAAGNITSTPDLTAFSWAVGLMLDVSKNPDLKPFKVGFFYGTDRVNPDSAVKYKNNLKPWIAFQIGYDFTDSK